MFSTTPAMRWWVCRAMEPARSATSWAASCGVVTTRISALGTQLRDRDGDVAGAGRQVHQQDVEVAPVDVGEELLQRAVQHRPAPHDRGVVLGEHADRDDLHAVRGRRHDHRLDLGRLVLDAEHARHREAVDVGVDDPDVQAAGGHRGGQVDRDGALADAALAGRDREDAGQRARLRERDLALRGVALEQRLQPLALLGRHDVELDGDPLHARQGHDRAVTSLVSVSFIGQPATVR